MQLGPTWLLQNSIKYFFFSFFNGTVWICIQTTCCSLVTERLSLISLFAYFAFSCSVTAVVVGIATNSFVHTFLVAMCKCIHFVVLIETGSSGLASSYLDLTISNLVLLLCKSWLDDIKFCGLFLFKKCIPSAERKKWRLVISFSGDHNFHFLCLVWCDVPFPFCVVCPVEHVDVNFQVTITFLVRRFLD